VVPDAQVVGDTAVEVGRGAQAALDDVPLVADGRVGEDLAVEPPADLRAAQFGVAAGDGVLARHAAGEGLRELLALAPDGPFQPLRQRIDDGRTDAGQPARGRVGRLREFSARGWHRRDYRRRRERLAVALLRVERHAARLVAHRDPAIPVDLDPDVLAVAGNRLVSRVVERLPDEVVQAGGAGGADVHAGAGPDRLDPFE